MSGTLVVFYTKHGNSEKIAYDISTKLNGKIDEIVDLNKYKGVFGYLHSIFDSYFEKETDIRYKLNPEDFTSVVVISPTWVGKMPPAVRNYLKKNLTKMKSYGFIINSKYSINKSTLKYFRKFMPKSISEFGVENADMDFELYHKNLEDFADRIRIVLEEDEVNE